MSTSANNLVRCITALGLTIGLLWTGAAQAADALLQVQTRGTEKINYWWMPHDKAIATVVLFPGGPGGMGYRNGQPESSNFLVRTRQAFFDQGFNVVIVGNPTDQRALSNSWRVSRSHVLDTATILNDVLARSQAPIWIIGTSKGTMSAATMGIELQDRISGIVLTSSVTAERVPESVPLQALDRIKLPVLVYHHREDACSVTPPGEAHLITDRLTASPVKKLMLVSGGAGASGDPCEALHCHGFIGMESQAVADIANWIKNPQP